MYASPKVIKALLITSLIDIFSLNVIEAKKAVVSYPYFSILPTQYVTLIGSKKDTENNFLYIYLSNIYIPPVLH